ncbi:hypothetical protein DK872_26255 [Kosakonia sp. MH5]|nr:hypothetical protein [Kosakonia sp. MH5]
MPEPEDAPPESREGALRIPVPFDEEENEPEEPEDFPAVAGVENAIRMAETRMANSASMAL